MRQVDVEFQDFIRGGGAASHRISGEGAGLVNANPDERLNYSERGLSFTIDVEEILENLVVVSL